MKARIFITLKPGIIDPQGRAIEQALGHMEISTDCQVRQGKFFEIAFPNDSKESAQIKTKEMCNKLLANPVIEDYSFEIVKIL